MLCRFLHQHYAEPCRAETVFSDTKVVYSERKEGGEEAIRILYKTIPWAGNLRSSPVSVAVKSPMVLSSCPHHPKSPILG